MRCSEASTGRVFILRLDPGEILHEAIESFIGSNGIRAATVTALGGADAGSKLTVGPEVPIQGKVVPLIHVLESPCEFFGTGTVIPDESGRMIMHMHGSAGRSGGAVTGCCRTGIIVWTVMEVIITELVGVKASRKLDPVNGFLLLEIGE
jgi:uncharacterized protein